MARHRRRSHCVEPATGWWQSGYDLVSSAAVDVEARYDVVVRERRDPELPRDLTPEKLSFAVGVVLILVFVAVWALHWA